MDAVCVYCSLFSFKLHRKIELTYGNWILLCASIEYSTRNNRWFRSFCERNKRERKKKLKLSESIQPTKRLRAHLYSLQLVDANTRTDETRNRCVGISNSVEYNNNNNKLPFGTHLLLLVAMRCSSGPRLSYTRHRICTAILSLEIWLFDQANWLRFAVGWFSKSHVKIHLNHEEASKSNLIMDQHGFYLNSADLSSVYTDFISRRQHVTPYNLCDPNTRPHSMNIEQCASYTHRISNNAYQSENKKKWNYNNKQQRKKAASRSSKPWRAHDFLLLLCVSNNICSACALILTKKPNRTIQWCDFGPLIRVSVTLGAHRFGVQTPPPPPPSPVL